MTKILSQSKLKVIADHILNVTKNLIFFFQRLENIVEKEENAGYQHFSFSTMFLQGTFLADLSM